MDGLSLTPQDNLLNRLKELMPEAFTEERVDWEKLKATLGEDISFSNERYVLNWAGKGDVFKVLQSPSSGTLIPVYDESLDFFNTRNIFIEGENLEVLKVLQKSYFGKINMIYIDPPYNTGNDSFIYPDKFSETKDEYQKRVGDKDVEGLMTKEGLYRRNGKENGQYHSNWLNMMYPRLFMAKNLLHDLGVIFISIDDNEVHNLRLLLNEIFGEENFVGELVWKSRQNKDNRNVTGLSIDHEYVLCYSKSNNARKLRGAERKIEQYSNPDNDERGAWVSGNMVGLLPKEQRPNCHYNLINPETGINYGKPKMGWRYDQNTMARLIEEKRVLWPKDPDGRPRRKVFLDELNSELPNYTSIIGENVFTRDGTKEIDHLFGSKYFDFPKPTALISELITQASFDSDNDIILDFFSGSGTTAHSVMNLNKEDLGNRNYICVQFPEPCYEASEAYQAGYLSIADIAKERIRRASIEISKEVDDRIETLTIILSDLRSKIPTDEITSEIEKVESEIKTLQSLDVGFKVFKLSDSNFKQWQQITGKDPNALKEQMNFFIDPLSPNASIENMVYELLLKSGKNLNSIIDQEKDEFFSVNNNELILLLESATQEIIESVLAKKPMKVIALDRLFKENDQLKTNTALQMKDAGIEFKTI